MFRPAEKVPGMLLYAGRLSPEKQVDLLIRAAAQIPGTSLHLAGDGSESHALLLLGESLKASLVWHGFMAQRDLADLMGRASVFVLASKYEQASKVLLEAMACGCLVVATPEASRGIIVDGRNGYFCLPMADYMAGVIRFALDDPSADQIRAAAREYVLRCHSA